jgi:putative membrane protein
MMYYGPGMSAWGYLLMTANMLLFWVLVVAGIAVLVRYFWRPGPAGPGTEAILAERFARGEIDEEEYRSRLRTLRGGQPT